MLGSDIETLRFSTTLFPLLFVSLRRQLVGNELRHRYLQRFRKFFQGFEGRPMLCRFDARDIIRIIPTAVASWSCVSPFLSRNLRIVAPTLRIVFA